MAAPAPPGADAKIGVKIDYVAKFLGERLKPLGFARRARAFHRIAGASVGEHVLLLDLQGDKWNEGRRGKFTVNLGVCFPALLDLQAALPGLGWIAQHAKPTQIPFGPGGFQGRLNDAVPPARDPRWPKELRHGDDFWCEIDETTDLSALADGLAIAVVDHAPAWFDARSRLTAFGLPSLQCFGMPGPREAVLAAMLDGDRELAAQRLRAAEPQRLMQNAMQFGALVDLLRDRGVDVAGVAWTKAAPDPMHERRAAEVASLREAHATHVRAFLETGDDWRGREDALLDAWVHAAASDQLEVDQRKLALWPMIAAAPVEARRALLLRAIARVAEPGVAVKSTDASVWATYDNYNHDAWSALATLLFAADDAACDAAHAAALLGALATIAHLVREELTCDAFVAPIAEAVRWIDRRADAATRYAARQRIVALLDAISAATIARCRARYATPPRADLFGPEHAAQLAASYTPEAAAQMEAMYARFPERAFAGADRDAVLLAKRRSRADADGRVPFEPEDDDWGRELAQAIDALPADIAPAMRRLLAWFDTGVETKPGKAWSAELSSRATAFERGALLRWLADALSRFERTALEHVAATPGTGAFPGETSHRALLGLVHLAGVLDAPELAAALHTVAAAAYTVVPGQRMRAQGVGNACLAPLARSAEGREFLAGMRNSVKQKPVRDAIDKALAT